MYADVTVANFSIVTAALRAAVRLLCSVCHSRLSVVLTEQLINRLNIDNATTK